jgi:hypothetical protein
VVWTGCIWVRIGTSGGLLFLSIYGFLNDASSPDHIASNGWMISEWNGKNLKKSGGGLFCGIILAFAWRDWGELKNLKIAGLGVEIWTWDTLIYEVGVLPTSLHWMFYIVFTRPVKDTCTWYLPIMLKLRMMFG